MRRYWLHLLAVLIVTGLIAGACVVRTAPGHRGQGVSKPHHEKHKKHKKAKKHKKHRGD